MSSMRRSLSAAGGERSRASVVGGGSSWSVSVETPLRVEVDLQPLSSRKDTGVFMELRRVEARRNVFFDIRSRTVNVLRDLKFKSRWYGAERVDDPSADYADCAAAQAVALDLAAIFRAYPGPTELVRLRRTPPVGAHTPDHEAWLQKLALNQVERLKKSLVELGLPPNSITCSVDFGATAGFLAKFAGAPTNERRVAREANLMAKVKAVALKGNVTYDLSSGKVTFARPIPWKAPRPFVPGGSDPSAADFSDPAAARSSFRDAAEILNAVAMPATVIVEAFITSGSGSADEARYAEGLARARAICAQKVLEECGVPKGRLTMSSGLIGDGRGSQQRARSAEVERLSPLSTPRGLTPRGLTPRGIGLGGGGALASPRVGLVDTPRGGQSFIGASRLRVRTELQKLAASRAIEDIPKLEELLEEARRVKLEDQWSRVDPLISDAEHTLKMLCQRRRRFEAWTASKARDIALQHVKVANVTRASFVVDPKQLSMLY